MILKKQTSDGAAKSLADIIPNTMFISTLNKAQKEVIRLIIDSLVKFGVTNKFMQAAVLAVVSKETGFTPVSEISYKNTSNARIRQIFEGYVSGLTDEQLNALKSDDEAFFNRVYGGRYGNAANEGYKYRGRGLNGITFKSLYQKMQKYTSENIVDNPDLVNRLDIAIDLLCGYFVDMFKSSNNKMVIYSILGINSAKTLNDAVGAVYHANAGWGNTLDALKKDTTGGRKKAFDRAPEMLIIVEFLS
jgi:putative chitinase